MKTFLWAGSPDWQDEVAVRHAIEGFPRPFRSLVGEKAGFEEIVWKLLVEFKLPRLRLADSCFPYWVDKLNVTSLVTGWLPDDLVTWGEANGLTIWRIGSEGR